MYAPPPPRPMYSPRMPRRRPFGVTLLGILIILIGLLVLFVGLLLVLIVVAPGSVVPAEFSALLTVSGLTLTIAAIVTVVGALWLVAGIGLLRLRTWAWALALIASLLGAVAGFLTPPVGLGCGTIFGIVVFIYLIAVRRHFR